MGSVGRFYDKELKRDVAIKRPDLFGLSTSQANEAIRLMRQEAQALAKLDHEGVARIYTIEWRPEMPGGSPTPLIVSEFVEGRVLASFVEDGQRMEPHRALDLVDGLLDALAYCHGKGVLHRDIKPSNVMVTPNGKPKLIDFGIAKLEGSTDTPKEYRGRGTAFYMSPEQAQGYRVDERTDIYSLGCLLFHLLTGRPPFLRQDSFAVALAHIQTPPPKPSQVNSELSPELDALVLKALQKQADQRFPTCAAMHEAIRRLLPSRNSPVATPSPRGRRALLATTLAAALVTGLGFGLYVTGILTPDSGRGAGPVAPGPATTAEPGSTVPTIVAGQGNELQPVAPAARTCLGEGFLAAGWGPKRPTYSFEDGGAPYPVFNSLTDNAGVGDERNFLQGRVEGSDVWADSVDAKVGDTVILRLYINNGGRDDLVDSTAGSIHGANLRLISYRQENTHAIFGVLSADNAITVWDAMYVEVPDGTSVNLEEAPVRLYSNATDTDPGAGRVLDGACSPEGAPIGYAANDGVIRPEVKYSMYAIARLVVD